MASDLHKASRTASGGRSKWGAIAIGLAGLAVTLGVVRIVREREHQLLSAEFELRASERAVAIQREFEEGAVMVRSTASLFHASENVSREEFRNFVMPLIVDQGSMAGIGYNPIVNHDEREAFEAALRADGFGEFGIVERDADGNLGPAPIRPEYIPVKYTNPVEGNLKAIGFNVASESSRRMAAERARFTHTISASGPINLVQDDADQAGFLLFAPINEQGSPESRVTGFAVGIFRVGQLVENALDALAPLGIVFEIVDETDSNAPSVLYLHTVQDPGTVGLFIRNWQSIEASHQMEVAGRRWVVRARPTPAFVQQHQTLTPMIALGVGAILSMLTMLYLLRLAGLNQRVATSEADFRQITETIQEVFWIFNAVSLEPEYVSPAFELIYGRTRDALKLLPNGLVDCVHPEDQDRVLQTLELLRQGKPTELEYRIVRDNGTVRWISDRRFPVPGGNRQSIARIIGVSADITPRMTAELERDRLQQKAIQTQKLESLGTLAGGLAHEFNNLLMTIQGHAEMSLRSVEKDSPAREDLAKVLQSTEKAADLVVQMLASAGKGQFVISDIQLSRLIARMRPLLAAAAEAPQVRLVYDLADDLPAFQGDPVQIQQIVMNLVTNAVEALPPHGGTVAVRTDTIEAGKTYLQSTILAEPLPPGLYLYVEVEDTGTGMSPQTIQHIFDPFYTTKFTGRGLGMAAVLGIVRSQKGAIRIDSTPGQGTAVRVLFPAATAFWPPADLT